MNASLFLAFICALPVFAVQRCSFRLGPDRKPELLLLGSRTNGFRPALQNHRLPADLFSVCLPFGNVEICRANPDMYDGNRTALNILQPFRTAKFEFIDWELSAKIFFEEFPNSSGPLPNIFEALNL